VKKVATIILNRNLPGPTNRLVEHLKTYDSNETDVYVVEAGSDVNLLSKYCTWHVLENNVVREGLRYPRGMNYGLSKLIVEGRWEEYEAFFLLTNDTELEKQSTVNPLLGYFDDIPNLGILSPCSRTWGERRLIGHDGIKCFWFIHNNAYFIRRSFIDEVRQSDEADYLNLFFDGSNFRGYGTESEVIAKAYANDWCAAITTRVWASENEEYLRELSSQIKTEAYSVNLQKYLEEGKEWMRRKYGFNSRWVMQQYVKSLYDNFFEFHPEYEELRI